MEFIELILQVAYWVSAGVGGAILAIIVMSMIGY